jgi:ribosomal protein L40E
MNKFCPRCGATNSSKRTHCRKCGYAHLHPKRRKNNLPITILLIIILLMMGWVAFRFFTNQQIIPEEVIEIWNILTT